MGRLAQAVVERLGARAQALGIGGEARRVLDQPRQRRRSQGRQAGAPRQGGEQARIGGGVVRRALDLALHVGVDAEERGELGVVLAEQVVGEAIADQHHLELERHRLGLELHRAGHADQLGERLDAQARGLERALEALPGEGLGQQLERVEHQEAAVGAVQRAGADQGEVAHQGAHVHQVIDAPDQVLQRGVVLVHHRSGAVGGVGDEQIDQVALHADAAGVGQRLAVLVGVRGRAQRLAAGDDVDEHRVQMRAHLGQVGVADLELVDHVGDGGADGLAPGVAHAVLQLVPPAREVAHQAVQALVQRADVLAELVLARLGQLLELLLGERAALVLHRQEGEAVRRAQQRHAELLGLVAEAAQGTLLARLGLFLQGLDAVAVLLALEHRADRRHQLLDEAREVVAQRGAAAAGQAQQPWLRGVGEVPRVAPVRGRVAAAARLLEQATHERVAAAAGVAEHEQVVALGVDVETEPDRVDRAAVDAGDVELGQLGGGLDAERRRIAAGYQALDGQGGRRRERSGHGRASCAWGSRAAHLTPRGVVADRAGTRTQGGRACGRRARGRT